MTTTIPDREALGPLIEPRHRDLAEELPGLIERRIAPLGHPETDDEARELGRTIAAILGDLGLVRHTLPAALEGTPHGPDVRACCLVREALAATSPLADAIFALQGLGSTPLALGGRAELVAPLLEGVASGELIAAFAMTEPEAGSDVASLATIAERDGNEYVIRGTKTFISNAGIADFYVVFARTSDGPGSRGISAFLVPADRPGLSWSPQVMSAPHPLGTVTLDGVRVPDDHRLGEEGQGFKIGMTTLDRLRPTVAAAACGMAAGALAAAVRHATSRHQFGAPLADLQLVQADLASMEIELHAARLLVYRAAWASDTSDGRVTREIARAKAFATEAAQRIVDRAVQIHGGRGVLADSYVDLLYRSVRALRIYEGTTEIQHLIVARYLLEENR